MGATLALNRTDLVALDPDTRAFTLVGAYLGYFALLEAGINEAIKQVLNLRGAGGFIVTRGVHPVSPDMSASLI